MTYPEEAFVVDPVEAAAPPVAVASAADEATQPAPSFADGDIEIVVLGGDDGASERMAPPNRAGVGHAVEQPQVAFPIGADADTDPDMRSDPADMPSFVRRAEREARWRQPKVRAALATGCVATGLLLAGQWMVAQRDLVAARSPGLKPVLSAACSLLGCEVLAPRALDALRVESSGVVRVDKGDLYRLNVALRNLRTHEVALPAFELALTDTQGQLIARRVLRAGELGARVTALGAGAELALQCTIQVTGGAVAGYTIELFYP